MCRATILDRGVDSSGNVGYRSGFSAAERVHAVSKSTQATYMHSPAQAVPGSRRNPLLPASDCGRIWVWGRSPRLGSIPPGVSDEEYRQFLPIVWAIGAVSEYTDLGRPRIRAGGRAAAGFGGRWCPISW